jgi:hypothetical protein
MLPGHAARATVFNGREQFLIDTREEQVLSTTKAWCSWTGLMVSIFLLTGFFSDRATGATPQEPSADAATRCKALAEVDFSTIPDAPTLVTEAKLVAPSDDTPSYCDVRGYVAPNVGVALRLPSERWNRKFIELGCGGPCGSTDHVSRCQDPLRRGYACIVSDGGHKLIGGSMNWAYNNPQAAIEYFVQASHVTAIAGKAIVARYYSQNASESYFMGGSAGGIQAMWEAQRFPWDFDGIIAGVPALRLSRIWLNWLWANRALMGKNGEPILGKPEFELLHRAVVAKCDMNDGVKDGVIGDPRTCHFDPSELRCPAAQSNGCLTPRQVNAVEKIYDGPVNSKGERIVPPLALRGSELSWENFFVGSSDHPNPGFNYLRDWSYYSIFAINLGLEWKPENFDFDRDYERLGAMEALEPNNPDLRRFKGNGSKLLCWTEWADPIEGVLNTLDYYETVEKVMGGRGATQDFFRLFVGPLRGHGRVVRGNTELAVDWLSYLEAWVERDHAPDKIIGSHVKLDDLMDKAMHGDQDALHALERRLEFPLDPANVEYSRPIYPYPIRAKYLGRGDPNQATSFGPVQP